MEAKSAAEAVYVSLGYAMSAYIKHAKTAEKLASGCALGEFGIDMMVKTMKPKRIMLNSKYTLNKTTVPVSGETATEKVSETCAIPLAAVMKLREGCSQAVEELYKSLKFYEDNEEIKYSMLTKAVRKECIANTVAYFRKLSKKADDIINVEMGC